MRGIAAFPLAIGGKLQASLVLLLVIGLVGIGGRAEPCTVMLEPGTPLQRAIDRAPVGAVICLAAGEWEERIEITKSLTLRGAGSQATTIRGPQPATPQDPPSDKPVIHITASTGLLRLPGRAAPEATIVLSGLSVTGGLTWDGHGLLVDFDGQVRVFVEDCFFSGNTGNGFDVRRTAQVTIAGSTFAKNARAGIRLGDSVRGDIEASRIAENEGYGVFVVQNAQVAIRGGAIEANRWDGVALRDAGQGSVVGATIIGNRWAGINVRHAASATVENCRIVDNSRHGVALNERPCVDTDEVFVGWVSGKGNMILRNALGNVCPAGLGFLTSEGGGELDRRE